MPVIIGGSIRGASIVSTGGKVFINGQEIEAGEGDILVIKGKDLPEVNEAFEGIKELLISGDTINITPSENDKVEAQGRGSVKKMGSQLSVDNFNGDLSVPKDKSLVVNMNQGHIQGQLNEAQEINLKVNSGDIRLDLHNREKPISITAKINSGSVTINVR